MKKETFDTMYEKAKRVCVEMEKKMSQKYTYRRIRFAPMKTVELPKNRRFMEDPTLPAFITYNGGSAIIRTKVEQ